LGERRTADSSTERRKDVNKIPASEPRELLLQAVRIQLASITAVSKLAATWSQAADRYMQAVGNELLRTLRGELTRGDLIGGLATASSTHLHDVSGLPSVAVRHFNRQLAEPVGTARTRKERS
jgi:hypothetical protein